MSTPASRERIAEIEHRMASPMVTYRENVRDDMPVLLATAEAYHALVADLRALIQHLRDLAQDERAQRDDDGFSRALAYDGAAERLSDVLDRHAGAES